MDIKDSLINVIEQMRHIDTAAFINAFGNTRCSLDHWKVITRSTKVVEYRTMMFGASTVLSVISNATVSTVIVHHNG